MKDYVRTLRSHLGHQPIMLVGAGIIIHRERQVLLQKRRDNGCWCYHGGSVDLGERVEEAARRELQEETGISAATLELLGVFSGPELHYTYPNGDEVYVVDVVFTCDDFSGAFTLQQEEVMELRWFDIDALPEPISPPTRPALQAFQSMMCER